MQDFQRRFIAAQQAYAAGNIAEAERLLDQVEHIGGPNADAFHLRALCRKQQGDLASAASLFATAHQHQPHDVQILGNWGNMLVAAGDHSAALAKYDRALEIDPGFADAHYNRGLALHRMQRHSDALATFDWLLEAGHASAKVHSARGAVLKDMERPQEAIAAFDQALAIDPDRKVALAGRARMALETGAADAKDRHIAALQRSQGDRVLVLGIVQAMMEQGDNSGLDVLEDVLKQDPLWLEGHHEFAKMRAEIGEGDAYVDHIHEAIGRFPKHPGLYEALAAVQASAGEFEPALKTLHDGERQCGAQQGWLFELARLEGECGRFDRAAAMLAALPDTDLTRCTRGRIMLGLRRPDEAASLLEALVARAPDDIVAWAYLGLAWRLTGDPRHEWLSGQPRLVQAPALDIDPAALADTADLLRSIHTARSHPVGQSLRGGTQTRGRLFWRQEPQIQALGQAIEASVAAHWASLPPRDATHPLLKHRGESLAIAGSWSVRLTNSGYHVAHIHPQGILSSACYIVVPQEADGPDKAGWLEVGAAPTELGLALDPLETIQPVPGRLALFPSYMFHGTRPFAQGERMTVAFDAVLSR
jgi:tetratricopeptide (TPR) repeat protein